MQLSAFSLNLSAYNLTAGLRPKVLTELRAFAILSVVLDKLREMFRNDAPYWRRRKLCKGIARRLLGFGEAQPDEDEVSGQFRLRARRTLEALEVNSRFLSHVESPRSPECQEKEERRLVAFKNKVYCE